METKRLVKSAQNRIICGVCGGIAQYFNIDATVIRLVWVLFCLAGGSGVLAYIIAAVIMPPEY
ncbi:MAG: PspC domain-containing protein [Eubacterium sp.]|nr:PspC domain-containing protein [Eubacterium sp.]